MTNTNSAHRRAQRRIASVAVVTPFVLAAVPAAADAKCRNYEHRAKIETAPLRTDLAYLNIALRVCYDGARITKAGVLDITPEVTSNALGTMKFEGVSPEPIREYRAWRGRGKGSFYVKAGGNWTQQVVGFEGQTDYVWASMRIFGNGNVVKDRQNG